MLPIDQNVFEFRKQFLKLAGGNFRVYGANEQQLFFSQQKAFKLREDITVFSDEGKQHPVLSIKTQQIIDFSPTFDVVDVTTGEKVGGLKRKGLKSILRDEWEISDASGKLIGHVKEDTGLLATLRRLLANLIPQKYGFIFDGQTVATFKQNFNPFTYRAVMDLSADTGKKLDRRLALAAGILLMAIEGKQG